MFYYAVRHGHKPGIYHTWDECKEQVQGFPNAIFKKFSNEQQAIDFVNNNPEAPDDTKTETQCYVFIDGSFNESIHLYGYGGLLFDGTKYHLIQGSNTNEEMASMRNVAGEVCGTMEAVKTAVALGIKDLTVYYDYEGIRSWATKNWKPRRQGTIEYVQFMRSQNINLKFEHVEAHTGVIGNEYADVIAKKAVGINLTKTQRLLYFDALKLCGLTYMEDEQ